ncbi:AraC family transcriptional regulator [Marinobacter nanhaiticus D15-8W]|uniref:AraC family transcriptional regulator n=1 Tax=Marinobacter nanhaiticus D15-8W TaxID=626887 RepID=N6W9L6_9GAMM|nr:AraC family transcriptional regulator [Marinobacter nanhaiticus]ENO16979.1 AraC family transcriptional regulator [Marinobacter nanhaiticus D15-8W]BES72025.1 AraC family transcriptional regulator [Marinobacter nanhaiticus D15-8W]
MTTTTSPLGTASVAALRQYVRAAEQNAIDTRPLLSEAGLDPVALADDARIEGARFQQFIRLLADATHNPILGLETGDYVQPGTYSVLGYITMSCATLGEAIQYIIPYEKLVGDMGITQFFVQDDQMHLVWQCAYTDPVVRPQMIDNVIASWISYARWLGDEPDTAPLAVHLERRSPGTEYEPAYRARWGCPVYFEATDNRVVAAKSLLDIPLRQPDPNLRRALEAHAQTQMAGMESHTALLTRVQNVIRHQLLQGVSRQDIVAEQLGMTSRTLQRKLSLEGSSYQKLLDTVRQSLAEDFLGNTDLPIPEIAFRLGFSETTSFHRRFKNRAGMTPGEYRERYKAT